LFSYVHADPYFHASILTRKTPEGIIRKTCRQATANSFMYFGRTEGGFAHRGSYTYTGPHGTQNTYMKLEHTCLDRDLDPWSHCSSRPRQ